MHPYETCYNLIPRAYAIFALTWYADSRQKHHAEIADFERL